MAGEAPTLDLSTVAVVGGGFLAASGVDNVQAGLRTAFSGQSTNTYGAQLISRATGMSTANSELAYGGLQLLTGVGATQAARSLAANVAARGGNSGGLIAESGLGRISIPSNLKYGTTLFGQDAHLQAGALLQARLEAQGVTGIINRTGPGLTGLDMSIDAFSARQLGFRHIEIKPNTASGLRSFNTQVRNWGYDPATVRAVTYDAQGNLRWGFDF